MRSGSNKSSTNWLFADSTTENSVQTIYSILNPSDQGALVTASFSQANGVCWAAARSTSRRAAEPRINLGDVVHGGGIAAVVTSNQPVVVERAEYIGSPDKATAGSMRLRAQRRGDALELPRWEHHAGPRRSARPVQPVGGDGPGDRDAVHDRTARW